MNRQEYMRIHCIICRERPISHVSALKLCTVCTDNLSEIIDNIDLLDYIGSYLGKLVIPDNLINFINANLNVKEVENE